MKKLLSVLLALAMVLTMTAGAFAASLEGTYQITIWVAEEIKDLTAQQIEAFNASKLFHHIVLYD